MFADEQNGSPDILIAPNQDFPLQFTGGSSSSVHELSLTLLDRGMKVVVLSAWSTWARGSYRSWLADNPATQAAPRGSLLGA
jgi:hypothetical protein